MGVLKALFTPNPPDKSGQALKGAINYLVINKSPLGDLGVTKGEVVL